MAAARPAYLQGDVATGATQGLLLADYLNGIMMRKEVPADLEEQARGSRYYRQYKPPAFGSMARPERLPVSNLDLAFEPELVTVP